MNWKKKAFKKAKTYIYFDRVKMFSGPVWYSYPESASGSPEDSCPNFYPNYKSKINVKPRFIYTFFDIFSHHECVTFRI